MDAQIQQDVEAEPAPRSNVRLLLLALVCQVVYLGMFYLIRGVLGFVLAIVALAISGVLCYHALRACSPHLSFGKFMNAELAPAAYRPNIVRAILPTLLFFGGLLNLLLYEPSPSPVWNRSALTSKLDRSMAGVKAAQADAERLRRRLEARISDLYSKAGPAGQEAILDELEKEKAERALSFIRIVIPRETDKDRVARIARIVREKTGMEIELNTNGGFAKPNAAIEAIDSWLMEHEKKH